MPRDSQEDQEDQETPDLLAREATEAPMDSPDLLDLLDNPEELELPVGIQFRFQVFEFHFIGTFFVIF